MDAAHIGIHRAINDHDFQSNVRTLLDDGQLGIHIDVVRNRIFRLGSLGYIAGAARIAGVILLGTATASGHTQQHGQSQQKRHNFLRIHDVLLLLICKLFFILSHYFPRLSAKCRRGIIQSV